MPGDYAFLFTSDNLSQNKLMDGFSKSGSALTTKLTLPSHLGKARLSNIPPMGHTNHSLPFIKNKLNKTGLRKGREKNYASFPLGRYLSVGTGNCQKGPHHFGVEMEDYILEKCASVLKALKNKK